MGIINGFYIEKLDEKQQVQLHQLCEEFQPYCKTESIVFLEVVQAARAFCDGYSYPFFRGKEKRFNELLMDTLISKIKNKYFFNGIKYSNQPLTSKQYSMVNYISEVPKIKLPSFGCVYTKHNASEKELFMKVVRACRDYMRTKMNKEAEPEFFNRLCVVYDAM